MGDQVIQAVNIGLDTNTTDMSSSLDINMLRLLDTCKLPVSSLYLRIPQQSLVITLLPINY